MTATQNLMPPVDPAALHCAPVEVEPILTTLTRQLTDDLQREGASVDQTIDDDHVNLAVRGSGRFVAVNIYFDDGDRLTALIGHDVVGVATVETVNAPDRGLAREILALLGGARRCNSCVRVNEYACPGADCPHAHIEGHAQAAADDAARGGL